MYVGDAFSRRRAWNVSPVFPHALDFCVPARRFQGGQLHLSGGQRPPNAIAQVRGHFQLPQPA